MPPFPHLKIGLLGLATIVSYGAWFYAFGVLLDPIIADTGWSETGMAATFTAGAVLVGIGAMGGGWLLDRWGSRRVFLMAGIVGGGGILAASWATSFPSFAVAGTVGSGALGGLSFYHITQTTAARIATHDPVKAIARLTIWGALSSPLFLPLTAWLVQNFDWRTTLRVLIVPTAVILVATAVWASAPPPDQPTQRAFRSVLAASRHTAEIRRFLAASALAGMTMSIVLVYQVPVMTSLGLPLTVAASVAAFRGFSQLFGRLPLTPIVGRLGVRRSYQLALVVLVVGLLLLLGSGSLPIAIVFAVLAGFGIGANSPLQGIYTAELYDPEILGSAMGSVTALYMAAGALGPVIVGALADATGSRLWAVAVAVTTSTAAVLIVGVGPAPVARTNQPVT